MIKNFMLCDVIEKSKVIVKRIEGLDEKLNNRLKEIGFVKNQKIIVAKNLKKTQTMVVNVRGCLMALDYKLAKCIIVEGDCE